MGTKGCGLGSPAPLFTAPDTLGPQIEQWGCNRDRSGGHPSVDSRRLH